MDDRRISRRELLRGRIGGATRSAPAHPIAHPGATLPSVISWLDPEMVPTPRRAGAGTFPVLRPPGALAEADFLATCTRCGDCASACPHDAIRLAPSRLREAADTPVIDPAHEACRLCEDVPCVAACEPRALRDDALVALGTARIQALDCLNQLGSTCSVCVERCPVPGAIDGVGSIPAVAEALCTGCGLCQHACPAPGNAVMILPNAKRPTAADLDARAAVAEHRDVAAGTREAEEPPLELPDLHEAELDAEDLRALFRALAALAAIDTIRLKGAPDERARAAEPTPDAALELLLSGAVRGAQLCYRYDGAAWCDTILPAPGGYRVVRIALE